MEHDGPDPFLIFSGHNDRAVIALCRYFIRNELPFEIVAQGPSDFIYKSDYANAVILQRNDFTVDIGLFASVRNASSYERSVYCPTTEFINLFVLENVNQIQELGFTLPLPSLATYEKLTNKHSSAEAFESVQGISIPREYSLDDLAVPCVIKPRENLLSGAIAYPEICISREDVDRFLADKDTKNFFAQEFVAGGSIYICGCFSADGNADWVVQKNLAQQANGKSIVLAREETEINQQMLNTIGGVLALLADMAYVGVFMIEFRQSETGLFFIEVNPRMWGPLQLVVDACPAILDRFVRLSFPEFQAKFGRMQVEPCFYLWHAGMKDYDLYEGAPSPGEIIKLAQDWDVFERRDYGDIHGKTC